MRDQIDRFLSVPGVGYTRESQEQYQRLSRLLLDYQQALRDWVELVQTLEGLASLAGKQGDPDERVATLLRQSILPWVLVLFAWLLWSGWRSARLRSMVAPSLVAGLLLGQLDELPFALQGDGGKGGGRDHGSGRPFDDWFSFR